MAANGNGKKSVVVLQLSGGNDALNTVIPYADYNYYDNRQYLGIPENEVLHMDDRLGLNPAMGPIKSLWDEGKVAVINGIGYPSPNRSHFRSMDVWHTAEPNDIAPEGWLGQAVRDLDPRGENVVTGVNFGRGLPRAMYAKDVPVASVGNLDTYGLMPDIKDERARAIALEAFSQIYGGSGKDTISQFISQVGMDALKGADILRTAPATYSSGVEYADSPISQNMKSIAQVMFADVGTRIYYTQHGSFDTHANELASHAKLWSDVSTAVADFMDDLKEHGRDKDTVVLMFSEFGRRIRGQRSRHRPRLRRRRVRHRRRRERRPLRRLPIPARRGSGGRRYALQQRLPHHLLHNPRPLARPRPRTHHQRQLRAFRLHSQVALSGQPTTHNSKPPPEYPRGLSV